MLLETTLIRQGGSTHELDGILYHFAPRGTDGRHVCEVATSAHVKRFLSIEGFEIADDEPVPVPAGQPVQVDSGNRAAMESTAAVTPPVFTAAPPPVQAATAPVLPQSNTAPIDLSILATVPAETTTGDDAAAEPKPFEAMTLEELRDAFFAKFGKAPHPKAKVPKIIEYLRNPPVQGTSTEG